MKKIVLLIMLAGVSFAFAEGGITGGIQDDLVSQISKFYPTFQSAAKGLLYSLAVISLVVNFGLMAVRGELEITGATAQLVKYALIVGFFSTLINSPSWFVNIHNALNNLAQKAGGIGNLEDALNNLRNLWVTWWELDFGPTEVANSIGLFIIMLVVSIIVFFMISTALTTYAFFLLSVYVGVFFLGFGSHEHTRPWAINAISNLVRNGIKWVLSMLIISIAISSVLNLNKDLLASEGMADFSLWFNFLGITIVFYSVNNGINNWVDSYFTGSGGGENSSGTQLVQTAMNAGAGAITGGLAGAKGAADTIAAAKASGQEMGAMGKIGAYAGGMTSGAAKGGFHGGDSFAKSWAKGIDPNSSGGGANNSPAPDKNKDWSNSPTSQDGDVGGGTSGSIAEPKVGGEINKNQY